MLSLGILLKRTLGPTARCAVPVALCAVTLAACGSQPKQPKSTSTKTVVKPPPKSSHVVYIYSSLPLRGPERSKSLQVEKGIEFALERAGNKAGTYRIKYNADQRLDDTAKPVKQRRRGRTGAKRTSSKQTSTGWDATQTWKNAQEAASNPQTVAYVGDLDSGATELSLPILNQAGIVQLTPGSGYPGLTDSYNSKYGINQTPNEPGKYYPQQSQRTLLRMIPSDIVQAGAVLEVLSETGCTRFAAWRFGQAPEAKALFNAVIATATKYPEYKLTYYKPPQLPSSAKNYDAYVKAYTDYAKALGLAPASVHCAVLVGHVTPQAAALTFELHEQLPVSSPIVGTNGFCSSRWLQEIRPAAEAKAVAPVLYCTTPALPVAGYSGGGRSFQRLFESAFHRKPTAYDYYGYVAAKLVIGAVRDVGPGQDPRLEVTTTLIDSFASTQLELYDSKFDRGDLQPLATYGVDDFVDGNPKPHKTVTPSPLLLSAG